MIDDKVLRDAQLIMLDMLKEFDALCQAHNLQYWLDSGTLLGAVRHQGFIPWDDDIDISMPQEDYDAFAKLIRENPSLLSHDIFFQDTQSDKSFLFDYMKLRSNKAKIVEFHEHNQEVDYHQGVFVDIFPMLSIRENKLSAWYYPKALGLIRFFSAKKFNIKFLRNFLVWSLDILHQKDWSMDNKIIYSGKMPDVASIFDSKEVFPLEKIAFEGYEFFAPKNPTHYLENIYSFDFMEIPPKEKRVIHAHSMEVL